MRQLACCAFSSVGNHWKPCTSDGISWVQCRLSLAASAARRIHLYTCSFLNVGSSRPAFRKYIFITLTLGSMLLQVRVFLLSTLFHEIYFGHRLFTVFSYMFGMLLFHELFLILRICTSAQDSYLARIDHLSYLLSLKNISVSYQLDCRFPLFTMSIPPVQLPQHFQSHRGAGAETGGRRTGRRTAEAAGLNINSGMQVEASGSLPPPHVVGSHSQPPPSTRPVGRQKLNVYEELLKRRAWLSNLQGERKIEMLWQEFNESVI